jgi:hypothetical protein
VELRYEVDFDALFHTPSQYWNALVPDYPIDSVRVGHVSPSPPAMINWNQGLSIDTTVTTNPLVLDSPLDLIPDGTPMDTTMFRVNMRPFPCLQMEVSGEIVARAALTYNTTQACVRYSSAPGDNYCWTQIDSFRCISAIENKIVIYVQVPCEDHGDIVVPFCPVKTEGELSLTLELEFKDIEYSLTYDCDELDLVMSHSESYQLETLLDETTTLTSSREDAIFAVPSDLTRLQITQPDSNSTVTVGEDVTIIWSDLDASLQNCCNTGYEMDLSYHASDEATSACTDTIVTGLTFTGGGGSRVWHVPSDGCFDGSRPVHLVGIVRCTETGRILATAISESFEVNP